MMLRIDPEGVMYMLDALLDKLEQRGISRAELKRDWKLPPNRVSYVRIAASPVPMILLLVGSENTTVRWWAFWLFVGLALSDWVDGKMARANNRRWASEWGALIDPIGDKLLVLFTLIGMLLAFRDQPGAVWLYALTLVILAREFTLTAQIRLAQDGVAKPTLLGKAKTAIQMVTIGLWLIPIDLLHGEFLVVMMLLTLVVTVVSWQEYYDLYVRKAARPQKR